MFWLPYGVCFRRIANKNNVISIYLTIYLSSYLSKSISLSLSFIFLVHGSVLSPYFLAESSPVIVPCPPCAPCRRLHVLQLHRQVLHQLGGLKPATEALLEPRPSEERQVPRHFRRSWGRFRKIYLVGNDIAESHPFEWEKPLYRWITWSLSTAMLNYQRVNIQIWGWKSAKNRGFPAKIREDLWVRIWAIKQVCWSEASNFRKHRTSWTNYTTNMRKSWGFGTSPRKMLEPAKTVHWSIPNSGFITWFNLQRCG